MLTPSIPTENLTTGSKFRQQPLVSDWRFRLREEGAGEVSVDLPHSPFAADLDGNDLWFGVCEYSRRVVVPTHGEGERVALYVGAAMQITKVLVDGVEVGGNVGGYLPFEIDLTRFVFGKSEVEVTIELDNRHHESVPPGKPIEELDFCWYGGLYQGVELRVYPTIYLTDSIHSGPAAGGVFIRTESIVDGTATLAVSAKIANASSDDAAVELRWQLADADGHEVLRYHSPVATVLADNSYAFEASLMVPNAHLWSPASPNLYRLTAVLLRVGGEEVLDQWTVTCGIRRIAFSRSGGFVINGRQQRLRGVNRHQDFPRVGYAAPRAAQYREAQRIKEAGFDYVRLSHYPQSPHFLDACDQFGLVVTNCIPGWQFFGDEAFQQNCAEFARRLVRRDRNHPCVVLWELSLNETTMSVEFMRMMHRIGHEEYPGDQMFTCGWQDEFDVYLHSRQHGAIHTWRNGDKALVVAEYGDWEYYANNEGFDQKSGTGLLDQRSNSRKLRGDGEAGLLRQTLNHVEALNDTQASPAVLDGLWSMNDYPRGYDHHRAACGLMDSFRLPKFSYYFFRSQRDATESGTHWEGGPMVFAATHWRTPLPDSQLWVFSNCDTVELRVNGAEFAPAKRPEFSNWSALPHPPFVFSDVDFESGELEALGRINGQIVARNLVRTPETPAWLKLWTDEANISCRPGESDLLMVHAGLYDAADTLCIDEVVIVEFEGSQSVDIIGPRLIRTEAGIASIVVRVPAAASPFRLRVRCPSRPLLPMREFNRVDFLRRSSLTV